MMSSGLQIPYRGERWLVRLTDLASSPLRWRPRPRRAVRPRRILVLRLERIGDLLMALDAIRRLRAAWPEALIDLAVGGWNRDLAALVPGIHRVETVDVPWLAREKRGDSTWQLVRRARRWRGQYDLVLNLEPDIRSNMLAWLSGAPRRVGYWTGGGGAFLTDALAYDPAAHTADNARRLVEHVLGVRTADPATSAPLLTLPAPAQARADEILAGASGPLIGVHVSGGRPSKQWHVDRFADVARTLAAAQHATIVLTGSAGDRLLVDELTTRLGDIRTLDLSGRLDLPALAAVLSRLDLVVTGDTGPMHLASAMGTPVVALFGPSDPRRYGPRGGVHRVIRIDLPCAPCGRVRLPPERCRGHVPECLDGITVARVVAAAEDLLREAQTVRPGASERRAVSSEGV